MPCDVTTSVYSLGLTSHCDNMCVWQVSTFLILKTFDHRISRARLLGERQPCTRPCRAASLLLRDGAELFWMTEMMNGKDAHLAFTTAARALLWSMIAVRMLLFTVSLLSMTIPTMVWTAMLTLMHRERPAVLLTRYVCTSLDAVQHINAAYKHQQGVCDSSEQI